MQEFDSVLTFAIDFGSNCIYRDIETSRMRFLKVGDGRTGPPTARGS